MSRSLVSLLLAAAVATAAALGAGDLEEGRASADDASGQSAVAAPSKLRPSPATPGLEPRAVVPERDRDVATAPDPDPTVAAPAPRRLRGTGKLLAAAGTSRDPIDSGGSTVQFSVEVEAATGLDPDEVAAVVEESLYDERSWASDHDLRRVAPADAWIHVIVATPDSVDDLCRRVGLRTLGWLSCWNGDAAAINLDRWNEGVAHYDDLDQYRRYVVSHEVGHGLGYDHRGCPGGGQLAPLMQQQTKSLQGCVVNEWRHPDG